MYENNLTILLSCTQDVLFRALKPVETDLCRDSYPFWATRHPDYDEGQTVSEERIHRVEPHRHILFIDDIETVLKTCLQLYIVNTNIAKNIVLASNFFTKSLTENGMKRCHRPGNPLVIWSPLIRAFTEWGLSLQQAQTETRDRAGCSVAEMSQELNISEDAVRSQRQRIREKERKATELDPGGTVFTRNIEFESKDMEHTPATTNTYTTRTDPSLYVEI